MHSDPLLTQAELDFLQQLTSQPARQRPERFASQPDIGRQLGELLDRLGDDQCLSLDTHGDGEHLSYPLRLVKDGRNPTRLELGAPLILEPGVIERPWRLALSSPLTLLDSQGGSCDLQVLELSSNGMLVRRSGCGAPARTLSLQLLLPRRGRVRFRAQLVRRLGPARYAYRLHLRQAQDEQALRQFLFEHHRSGQRRAAAPA